MNDRGDIIVSEPLYVPDNNHRWQAAREDYEPGEPVGYGSTPWEAEADLLAEEEWRLA